MAAGAWFVGFVLTTGRRKRHHGNAVVGDNGYHGSNVRPAAAVVRRWFFLRRVFPRCWHRSDCGGAVEVVLDQAEGATIPRL